MTDTMKLAELVADPAGSAEDQFFAEEDELFNLPATQRVLRVIHRSDCTCTDCPVNTRTVTLTNKEHTMTTDTTYDSGFADPEATIAEHIDEMGGIELLAAKMIERAKDAATVDDDRIDLDLDGYTPVEDIIIAMADTLLDEAIDPFDTAQQMFCQLALPKWFGQPNPDYITQLWLDTDGPSFTRADGSTGQSPTRMLVGVWLAGHTPTAVYFEDQRIFAGVDSEFPEWEPVSMRQFVSKGELVRHIRSQRPGFTPADIAKQRLQLATAREALVAVLRAPQADDPADPDTF